MEADELEVRDDDELMEWKRVEMALKKFDQAAKVHLDLLTNHRRTMLKLKQNNDNAALLREKRNADRTVRQLVTDLSQIMQVAGQLNNQEHVSRFRQIVGAGRSRIEENVREFCEACNKCRSIEEDAAETSENVETSYDDQLRHISPSNASLIATVEELEQNAIAHRQLLHDISELDECMKEMAKLVSSQGEMVDRIDANIESAVVNVSRGEQILSKISKNKNIIGGAVVGAVLAGPFGFVIGAKTALLAAIGGSAMGVFGSKVLAKKMSDSSSSAASRATLEHRQSYPKID